MAALLHDPTLIFDEPDSGLDVTAALCCAITNLAARGKIRNIAHPTVERPARASSSSTRAVVADDSVTELRTHLASSSLEQVFAHLVLRDDPQRTARDIADVVTLDT